MGLKHGDDLGETFITHFFKFTEYASLEEDFGETKSVLGVVKLKSCKDLPGDFFGVNET